MKKIGILGGMGPQASLDFYGMLIKQVKQNTSKPRNQDYPHLLLSNIPVPDLIENKNNLKVTVEMVNTEAKNLERIGANILVMPCNTMHLFKDRIMLDVNIPFLSMINCVLKKIQELNLKKVGLLGSATTLQSSLYLCPLNKLGIDVVIPEKNKHKNIARIIHKYIASELTIYDTNLLEKYCDDLNRQGAEAIILGCTELPLILSNSSNKYIFLSSSNILAEHLLDLYYIG